MKVFGALALVVGFICLLFTLAMDTSVASGELGQRVHNIGLMNQKQNLLLLFATVSVIGAVFMALGGRRTEAPPTPQYLPSSARDLERPCPFCAETIKRAALVCRFCQRELPEQQEQLPPNAPLPLGTKINIATETECLATLAAMGYVVTSLGNQKWGVTHPSTSVVAHARSTEQLQALVLRAAKTRGIAEQA